MPFEADSLKSVSTDPAPDSVAYRSLENERQQQSHERKPTGNYQRSKYHQQRQTAATSSGTSKVCRYFGTSKGCRAGDKCQYQHVQSPIVVASAGEALNSHVTPASSSLQKRAAQSTPRPTIAARAPVTKPVSSLQKENPREFQISQVVRRYSPFRADLDSSTVLKFRLHPTDPDFPFELEEGLQCVLTVPSGYPKDGVPVLKVENAEMARGFQINVEKGFEALATKIPAKSLLSLLNELDKNLEEFLTAEKARTVKIVSNTRSQSNGLKKPPDVHPVEPISPAASNTPHFSVEQLTDAKVKRENDIKHLEARMGRTSSFSRNGDGLSFNIPLQIARAESLPPALQSLKEGLLIVPSQYPLEPCTIMLKGAGYEADDIEFHFERHSRNNPSMTLMAHINYLVQNIHLMIKEPKISSLSESNPPASAVQGHDGEASLVERLEKSETGITDPERPHLRFVSKPPEWNQSGNEMPASESDSSDFNSEDSLSDIEGRDGLADGGVPLPATLISPGPERGVMVSFPGLELIGIELLQVHSLSITVKCDRCKTDLDVKAIQPSLDSKTIVRRTETCMKCSTPVTIQLRAELMHTHSNKAGYLDLEGGSTIVDMLPSTFLPTCSECSTTAHSSAASVSVRGETSLSTCRNCHNKLSFKLSEVKFLRVSNIASASLPLRQRKDKEKLGISAGTELPSRGNCKHYSKSYRWFRFSCCNKVFPCDKCHDDASDHSNEHAERMICGWCSREQRYRPEVCGMCGKNVIRKLNTRGFWEGGKGTREKALMSKKEKRKWKRVG